MTTHSFELEHTTIKTNGVNLHVVQAGPHDGPLVILLHGFPEFWYSWHAQIPALAQAGFRVIAPDQRGYNLSDKPHGVNPYDINELAKDIIGLLDATGREKCRLVGHDWGANVAWWLGIHYPQRIEKLVIINVPHPTVFQKTLRRNLGQLRRSWYVFAFQIPWIPEKLTSLNNWRVATQALVNTSKPGTYTESDLQKYREAWGQPYAMTAMINWYRAYARHFSKPHADPHLQMPTLVIWGKGDRFLDSVMAQPSADMAHGRLELFPDATHWVHHEEPERVNQLLIDFFKS